ncbi:MAG: phenylalanine--tRNA ligase subunit beta, partial [Candidatus Aenigmatarchaeota archaeon]
NDLISLIGRKMNDKELEEIINLIKPNVEEIRGNEIVIEQCADRPDLFGIEGLARAIRSYLEIETGVKKYVIESPKIGIIAEIVKTRPFIGAAVVKNFKGNSEVIESLMNVQEVLHETIGKKRERVAIGIHDFDKIFPPIKYTQLNGNERMIPLGEKEEMSLKEILKKTEKGRKYKHLINSIFPAYVDSKGVFSFPPILNSERTRVTEKTRNLLIELTGIEKKYVEQVLTILVTNFAERGCQIEAVKINYPGKSDVTPRLKEEILQLDPNDVKKILGIDITLEEMIRLLERMGYEATSIKGKLQVIIPCYRFDILHPVDLIEDIAIAYGYNNFKSEPPNIFSKGNFLEIEKICSKSRELMVGFGFQEILRPVLTNKVKQFEKMNLEYENIIEIENFVSEEYACMRKWILPCLIEFLSFNKHVEYPQKIFEIGDVVIPDEKEETMSKSLRKIAFATSHSKACFSEIKSLVESFLTNLGVEFKIDEFKHGSFIEGRVAKIIFNRKEIGFFGEISPKVLERWEIEMPIAACEIELDALLEHPSY